MSHVAHRTALISRSYRPTSRGVTTDARRFRPLPLRQGEFCDFHKSLILNDLLWACWPWFPLWFPYFEREYSGRRKPSVDESGPAPDGHKRFSRGSSSPPRACASRQRHGKRTGSSFQTAASVQRVFHTALDGKRRPHDAQASSSSISINQTASSLARLRRVGKTGSYQAGHLVGLPEHPIVVGRSIGRDIASERRLTSSATVEPHRPAERAPRQRQLSSAPIRGTTASQP